MQQQTVLTVTLTLLHTAESDGPITLHYNKYVDGSKIGTPATLEVDMVIGADGANSRVAKEIDAGEYDYAIAFQERIRIPGEQGSGSLAHTRCCRRMSFVWQQY
jgi:flavin-dependent dehydrogenase